MDKISPITRPPLIAIVLFAIAGVYSLIYGILTLKTIFIDVIWITSALGDGIAYVLNGGVMVGWTLLVTRKTPINKRKLFVICLLVGGVSNIAAGIIHIFDAMF